MNNFDQIWTSVRVRWENQSINFELNKKVDKFWYFCSLCAIKVKRQQTFGPNHETLAQKIDKIDKKVTGNWQPFLSWYQDKLSLHYCFFLYVIVLIWWGQLPHFQDTVSEANEAARNVLFAWQTDTENMKISLINMVAVEYGSWTYHVNHLFPGMYMYHIGIMYIKHSDWIITKIATLAFICCYYAGVKTLSF